MFWKKKKQQNDKKTTHDAYDVKYENLAVPEVHTEPEVEEEDHEEKESITFSLNKKKETVKSTTEDAYRAFCEQ